MSTATATRHGGILLSDVVHNAGPDPRDIAGKLDTLRVLLETDGDHDPELTGELAVLGRVGWPRCAATGTWRRR